MRLAPLLLLALTLLSCGRSEPDRFTLYQDQVKRIEGCHVVMYAAPGRGKAPFAVMRSACGVEESALKEAQWWGNRPEPLSYCTNLGDCLLFGETFYCAEEIKLGEATFKATYKWATRHHDHLEMIR